MKKIVMLGMLLLLHSCMYVTTVHTEGTASDIIDDTLSASASVPISGV